MQRRMSFFLKVLLNRMKTTRKYHSRRFRFWITALDDKLLLCLWKVVPLDDLRINPTRWWMKSDSEHTQNNGRCWWTGRHSACSSSTPPSSPDWHHPRPSFPSWCPFLQISAICPRCRSSQRTRAPFPEVAYVQIIMRWFWRYRECLNCLGASLSIWRFFLSTIFSFSAWRSRIVSAMPTARIMKSAVESEHKIPILSRSCRFLAILCFRFSKTELLTPISSESKDSVWLEKLSFSSSNQHQNGSILPY